MGSVFLEFQKVEINLKSYEIQVGYRLLVLAFTLSKTSSSNIISKKKDIDPCLEKGCKQDDRNAC